MLSLARLGIQVSRAEGPSREQVRVAWTPRAGRVHFSASLSRPIRQQDEELGTLGRGRNGVGLGGCAGGWSTPVPTSQQLRGVGAAPQGGLNSQGALSASTLGAERWRQQRCLGNKKGERERCKRGGSEAWTGVEVWLPGAGQRPRGQGGGSAGSGSLCQWWRVCARTRVGGGRGPGEASVHPDTGASALEGELRWGKRAGPGRKHRCVSQRVRRLPLATASSCVPGHVPAIRAPGTTCHESVCGSHRFLYQHVMYTPSRVTPRVTARAVLCDVAWGSRPAVLTSRPHQFGAWPGSRPVSFWDLLGQSEVVQGEVRGGRCPLRRQPVRGVSPAGPRQAAANGSCR